MFILLKGLISLLLGYGIGCINPAYLIARSRGMDIREEGSGNAGASNAIITMGAKTGAVCAFFDIFKAVFAIRLAELLFPGVRIAREIAGVACILGHIYPVQMKFRGGKGLACLAGTVIAYDWRLFMAMFVVALICAFIVDYICIVPIGASIAWPLIYLIHSESLAGAALLTVASMAMIYKHMENLERIQKGTEAHFSFLWKRDAEIERIKNNLD